MESLESFKSSLLTTVTEQCSQFDRVLKEELAKLEQLHAVKQQRLQQEISSLQSRVSKLGELEKQNVELRSKIERAAKRIRSPSDTQVPSCQSEKIGSKVLPVEPGPANCAYEPEDLEKSLQENKRILELLEKEKAEVARLYNAHARLQKRSRVLKERAKERSEYHDRTLAKRRPLIAGQRHNSGESILRSEGGLLIPHSPRLPRPSSSFSEENPDTPKPETALPLLQLIPDQQTQDCREEIVCSSDPQVLVLPTPARNPQDINNAIKDYRHIDKGNSSETCDDTCEQPPLPPLPQPWTHRSNDILASVLEDDESDVPVVVSERSLKRKRPNALELQELHLPGDAEHQMGSAGKPFCVKSEHGSSSPMIDKNTSALEYAHESLDLDEVGRRILTPRKRTRLQRLKTASQSEMRRALTLAHLGGTEGPMSSAASRGTSAGDIADSAADPGTNGVLFSRPEFCNELATKIAREMYGMLQSGLVSETPETHSRPTRSRLELRNLHNQKAHERERRCAQKQPEQVRHGISRRLKRTVDGDLRERARSAPIDATSSETRQTRLDVDAGKPRLPPLHPKTPNARILPRTHDFKFTSKHYVSKQRKDQDHATARYIDITEDREDNNSILKARSPHSTVFNVDDSVRTDKVKTPRAADMHYRLNNLLTEPSPETPMLLSLNGLGKITELQHTPKTPLPGEVLAVKKGSLISKENLLRTTPASVVKNSPRHLTMTHMNGTGIGQKHTSEGTPGIATPEHEPLRAQPLHRLRLDDFKINPNHNQGKDFAFNEVVRNRDQRICLPNCTKPECCGGMFHKIVEMGGWTGRQTHGLWDSSPLDERDEDDRLLQDYLGTSSASLARMSELERATLLTEAKAKKLANEYGRHRQNFERPSSPAGFWRTDMPTTQEAEADREQARKAERVKVEERYREALRGHGRWKFRDE
ncbi:MAG: hypothetical protein Q9187_000293 [Circinaria calcarea]